MEPICKEALAEARAPRYGLQTSLSSLAASWSILELALRKT